jgi:hypothetical protein
MRFLVLAVMAVALGFVALRASLPKPGKPSGMPLVEAAADGGESTYLQGPVLRAASVAVADMVAFEEQVIASNPNPQNVSEVTRCFDRAESYDVRVREAPDRYIVEVIPIAARCLKKGRLLGGDGTYEISKERFEILKKDYGE